MLTLVVSASLVFTLTSVLVSAGERLSPEEVEELLVGQEDAQGNVNYEGQNAFLLPVKIRRDQWGCSGGCSAPLLPHRVQTKLTCALTGDTPQLFGRVKHSHKIVHADFVFSSEFVKNICSG